MLPTGWRLGRGEQRGRRSSRTARSAKSPDARRRRRPALRSGRRGRHERELNGGAPDNAFAEGGAGNAWAWAANCLIQINGGYTVLDAQGDGVDSNGSVEITGGVRWSAAPRATATERSTTIGRRR
ncbi:MAG: hypothetical protein ACLTMP_09545 [Eggerthella lenta]